MSESKAESRRAWTDPALVVLVRNRPEEAVLAGCKVTTGAPGADTVNDGCSTEACGWECASWVSS